MDLIPSSTQWTLDAAGSVGRATVPNVFLVYCTNTQMKGTGFLLKSGHIVTNEQVVRGCSAVGVVARSSFGQDLSFSDLVADRDLDLALLTPATPLSGGLSLEAGAAIQVGMAVTTWGFPLGYNGPSPLLSVGYLAGFVERPSGGASIRHLVVNGAFNPGNSGGPLFRSGEDGVIGVVVSKHAPISKTHLSAIQALAENKSGVVFTGTDDKGSAFQVVESQIVADQLSYFRDLTQVMIGEAIAAEVLAGFLTKRGIAA